MLTPLDLGAAQNHARAGTTAPPDAAAQQLQRRVAELEAALAAAAGPAAPTVKPAAGPTPVAATPATAAPVAAPAVLVEKDRTIALLQAQADELRAALQLRPSAERVAELDATARAQARAVAELRARIADLEAEQTRGVADAQLLRDREAALEQLRRDATVRMRSCGTFVVVVFS